MLIACASRPTENPTNDNKRRISDVSRIERVGITFFLASGHAGNKSPGTSDLLDDPTARANFADPSESLFRGGSYQIVFEVS